MAPQVIIGSVQEMSHALIGQVRGALSRGIVDTGRGSLALPGGSVATTFFPMLAASDIPWSAVEFFWCDERAVPAHDPESNYGLARQLLLDPVGARRGRVHGMVTGDPKDLDAAARAYDATLASVLGAKGTLDCVLLGVGPDGHVASLFPGHPVLDQAGPRVAAVRNAPKAPPRRLTLSLPFIVAARLVVIVAMGAAKATVMAAALDDPESALPVARVGREARECVFLLDAAAGSLRT